MAVTTLYICTQECSVRISNGTPAVLIDVSRGFPQFVQTNSGIISRLGQDHFFQFFTTLLTNHLIFNRCSIRDTDNIVK
jgi:hypothetical protein